LDDLGEGGKMTDGICRDDITVSLAEINWIKIVYREADEEIGE
jgi:hypothetical protein